GSKLTPEIWNPDSGEWREVASMVTPRNYHSVAILLADGRILVGGGGLSEDQLDVNHQDVEIYSPPYLFDDDGSLATRPAINTAPATVGYGETFSVTTSTDISNFSLIKLSSITHQMNTDLRFLEPQFSEVSSGQYNVTTHSNTSVLTPGYYMLFAMDDDGVPSEAHILQVSTAQAPEVTHPGNLSNTQGEQVSITIPATDPLSGSLTFSANNLPPGLSINSVTGEISGAVSFDDAQTYKVTITIRNAVNSVDVVFYWEINYLLSEAGRIIANQGDANSWHEVDFYYTYEDPIVVLGPVSQNDAAPLTIRVQNVTSNGFEFQLDEWDYLDGSHGSEQLYYLVVEAGSYVLDDGSLLTAVSIPNVTHATAVHSFPITFNATPLLFAQAVTTNEASAISTQISSVSTTQFSLALVEEEANDNSHAGETVHTIAIEPTMISDRLEAASFITPALADWTSHSFTQTYSETPVFVADQQTVNSSDPSALRLQNLNTTGVEILVEEEASSDAELVPASETVGYLVIDPVYVNNPFSPNALPPNNAPVFNNTAVNQTNVEGEWLSYTLAATDDDSITYTAEGLPPSVTINAITGEISGPVVAGDAATYNVTVFASDKIFSSEQSFTWIIDPAEGGWSAWADETNSRLDLTGTDSFEKDLAIGDLDQNGWDDIVIVRKNAFDAVGGQSDILLMNNNGQLEDKTSDYVPEFLTNQTDARDVVMADLDGDGWLDVIIASTFEDPPVLYRNQGMDAFGNWLGLSDESSRLPSTYDTGTVQFCAVTVGDVNGDDEPDIYFANYAFESGAQDVLLINDGFGNFTEESETRLGDLRNSAFGTAVQIIDMNNDQKNDIVKLSAEYAIEPFNKAGVFTLLNNGDGTFTNFEEIPSNDAYMFMVAHLNEDQVLDVFVQEDAQDLINFGSTDSGYATQMINSARTVSHGGNFQFADIDRDGDLDLGLADVDTMFPPCDTGNDSVRKFVLLKNDGNGGFSDPYGASPEVWNQNMFDFAFIDIDRDGNMDIFAAECDGYGVYMNTAVPSANQPPIITDLADQNSDEGDTLSIDIIANDADGDSLTITVTGLPDSLSFNPATKKIAGYLSPSDAGLYVITITATDGDLSDVSIFVLTVGDVNQTPVIVDPGDLTFTEDGNVNFNIVASDYEGSSLTYTITGLPDSLSYDSNSGLVTGTLLESDIGTHAITVIVTDGETQSQISFEWTVESNIINIYLPLILK
ncbi:MAG: putative Ig domain-containing protein, partial [Chloroflexota bacterium]